MPRSNSSWREFGEVLAFKVEAYGLFNIGRQLVKCGCLRHNGQVEALGYILFIAPKNPHVDDSLHERTEVTL